MRTWLRPLPLFALMTLAVVSAIAPLGAQDPTSGSLAATGDTVGFSLVNVPSATVQIAGGWAGTVVFEVTVDSGVTWQGIAVSRQPTAQAVQAATGNGLFVLQNAGYISGRARAVGWGAGTATITATKGFVTNMQTRLDPLVAPAAPPLPAPACNALLRAAGVCK